MVGLVEGRGEALGWIKGAMSGHGAEGSTAKRPCMGRAELVTSERVILDLAVVGLREFEGEGEELLAWVGECGEASL